MIRTYTIHAIRFISLILVQVLILDNIEPSRYLTPYIYVLFILLLPFETPNWLILLLGFVLGLSMDIISLTPGIHSASVVLISFLRPFILRLFSPRDGYDAMTGPYIHHYGEFWFVKYAAVLIFSHHFMLFSLEIFRLSDLFYLLAKTFLSGMLSVILAVLSQYLIFRQ